MEVCVDCVTSAVNAEAGGASRLELCSALSEGGLTPSEGFLRVVKSLVSIPVFVMIRPRRGLDFVYSKDEVRIMEFDIKRLKDSGADGFVFGALTPDRKVDKEVCSSLLQAASPLPCTFHRAFDIVKNPLEELETVISLGFKRILTSGLKQNAYEGVSVIKDLIKRSQGLISVMPGAGIAEKNLEVILKETGAKEFHASARKPINAINSCNDEDLNVSMGSSDSDFSLLVTDSNLVKEMVKISNLVWSES
ncbi:copper homeostasis protein cutC homolog [Macrosteles quadrilineatus]|uniref:copper homeostasis protein cutC homolog n=1 Tax=Macrosteles quadrilineatus TaxID=74068 RepID=UPI0023E131BF|nr:copper homeostasis protein cutC homolog [Macrosteles quadrilineatus]